MGRHLLTLITIIGAAITLSGCVIKHPQSASEFRTGSEKARSVVIERYQVARPLRKIARTFKTNTNKCLRGRVRSTSSSRNSYQVINTSYVPTLKIGKSHIELHLQQRHRGMVMNVSKAPRNGYYMYVVDVYAAGKKNSKITIYRPRWGYKHITRAIKGWIDGSNTGCPDLSKTR